MRFRTYSKIPKRLSDDTRIAAGTWVALEKLHGAHFVVATKGRDVRFGKRKEWLASETPFFGWQLIADDIKAQVLRIKQVLNAAELVVYGELIGGAYPHPNVAAIPGLSAVQTGIWYAPDLHWVVFDILIAKSDEEEGQFLAHHEIESLAQELGFLVPPLIRRGRRSELESVPTRSLTRFPQKLGLPAIDNNIAEGIILKPDMRMAPSERPVLKRKISEFDDAKFDESAAWSPGRLTFAELLEWVDRLVNPARMQSARSKVGENRSAILDEILLDVAIDLDLAFHEAWEAIGPEGQARLLEHARVCADELLNKP